MLGVKRYLLRLLGRLERSLSIMLLGIEGQGRLFAGHGHDSVQHLIFFGNHKGLGQAAAGCYALGGLLVIAGYGDDALGARHLHLEVSIVGDRHEIG